MQRDAIQPTDHGHDESERYAALMRDQEMRNRDRLVQETRDKERQQHERIPAEPVAHERHRLEQSQDNKPDTQFSHEPEPPRRLQVSESLSARREQEDRKEALRDKYTRQGDLAQPVVPRSGDTTAADYALDQERAFRERQQSLADQIKRTEDPHQRERLELVRKTEYHDYKDEQLGRIIAMQQIATHGTSPDPANEAFMHKLQAEREEHRMQGTAAIEALQTKDAAWAQVGENKLSPAREHGQANDTHSTAQTTAESNPAAERLRERQTNARERHDSERTPVADQSVASLRESRDKLAAAQQSHSKRSNQDEERQRHVR